MASDFSAALAAALNTQQPDTNADKSTEGDTFGQLARLIQDVTGVEEDSIERDASLDNLGVSSLALIELTVRAEERFKVRFEESTVAGFDTVGDVAAYIDAESAS